MRSLPIMHVIRPSRPDILLVLLGIGTFAAGQVIGRYPGVQYEGLRDDHCLDPNQTAGAVYCNTAIPHGRKACEEAEGKYDDKITVSKRACIDRCTEEGASCVGVRWQAVVKHCTILYGTCHDSDDGVNFYSEFWRKLQPSDFDIPLVGHATCNGTVLPCQQDGTDPCEAQDACLKMFHGCGGKFVQCNLDVSGVCKGSTECHQPCAGQLRRGKVDCRDLDRATCLHSFVERGDRVGEECMLVDERSCVARRTCGVIYPET
ncbi:unnamed protein product [Effrenium voratum]|nr:unnamed protein product [Effrenium voratum]